MVMSVPIVTVGKEMVTQELLAVENLKGGGGERSIL